MESNFLTNEEINAYVQYEAGNTSYFNLTEAQYAAIGEKIRSSDVNLHRYEASRQIYLEINELGQKKKFPLMAVAATVCLLIAFSVFFYFNQGLNANSTLAVNGDLPTAQELSVKFGLNETLDNRVNYPLRSAAITDILPENNQVFKGNVDFSWKVEQSTSFILKVYDKNEKLLYKQSSDDGTVDWTIPGDDVYYWSLEDDYEVLHWGKLYGLVD